MNLRNADLLPTATRYVLDLTLTRTQLLRYYRGSASAVIARSRAGQRLQLPLELLRPFVDEFGIRGTFDLQVGPGNRLQSIRRVC